MFVLSWRVGQSPGAGGVWVSLLFPEWNTSSELQKRLAIVLFLHQTDGFLRFSGIWNRAGSFSPLFHNAWQSHFNFVSLFLLSCPIKYQPDMLSFQTEGVWSCMLLQGSITCLSLGKPAIAWELFWPHFKFSSYPCLIPAGSVDVGVWALWQQSDFLKSIIGANWYLFRTATPWGCDFRVIKFIPHCYWGPLLSTGLLKSLSAFSTLCSRWETCSWKSLSWCFCSSRFLLNQRCIFLFFQLLPVSRWTWREGGFPYETIG